MYSGSARASQNGDGPRDMRERERERRLDRNRENRYDDNPPYLVRKVCMHFVCVWVCVCGGEGVVYLVCVTNIALLLI